MKKEGNCVREIFDKIAALILIGVVLLIFVIGIMPGLVEEGIISFKTILIVFGVGFLSLVWITSWDEEKKDDE